MCGDNVSLHGQIYSQTKYFYNWLIANAYE